MQLIVQVYSMSPFAYAGMYLAFVQARLDALACDVPCLVVVVHRAFCAINWKHARGMVQLPPAGHGTSQGRLRGKGSAALVVGHVQDVVAVCDCAGRRFDDQARERHHERVHRLQSEWPRLGHLVDLLSRAMHREGTTWIVLQGRRLCHGWRFPNS